MTQVTIVGGGSYQWAPELMADLFGTPSLSGMHLVLEDIDPAPLPKMEALAHKVNDALDAKATVRHDDRPAPGPRRCRLRHRLHLHRRLPLHGGRSRRAGRPRHPPDGGRHGRPRWHQPCPAQHPGAGRHRQGHGGALPGRLAPQHHQPDDLPDPLGVPGDLDQDGRPLPRGRQLHAWTWPSPWASPGRPCSRR